MSPEALSPDQMRTWRTYIRATHRLLSRLEADLGPHGLTLADYEILAVLSEAPERRLRMCDLASGAEVSASRLTYRVDRLLRQGLVERQACPEDKRSVYAVLTDAGLDRIRQAYPTHLAGVREYFTDAVPNQRQVERAMARIVDALDQDGANSDSIQEEV